MGISDPKTRKIGNIYQETQTIQHKGFKPLAELFQQPGTMVKQNAVVGKTIPANIGNFLSPIAVGSWYCGDGGRRDYGKNEGKAIQFHTQGFSKACCNRLAQALTDRYGWELTVREDGLNKKGVMTYLLQVEAQSFESFCEIVAPYILPHFQKRLPSPRKS